MRDDSPSSTGEPRVLAEVGGLVDETRVTLGLYGADLDPDEVSKILGCTPSHSHRCGEPRPRTGAWPKGAWVLSIEGKAPAEPEHLLSLLLDRLPENPRVWDDLRSRFDARLGFGLFQHAWNRGFTLSPDLLRRVAALGLALDFNVYAEGDSDGV